jgi:hypothetical protein
MSEAVEMPFATDPEKYDLWVTGSYGTLAHENPRRCQYVTGKDSDRKLVGKTREYVERHPNIEICPECSSGTA